LKKFNEIVSINIMKILQILIGFAFSLVFVSAAFAVQEQPKLQVVVFGDELTGNQYLPPEKRFDAQLEKKLRDIGFVVNVSSMPVIATSSSDAMRKLDNILAVAPDVVIIQLGEEDIKRGLDPSVLRNNIIYLVDVFKSKSIYPIVMGTKAPASRGGDYAYQIEEGFNRIGGKAQLYRQTLGEIAGNPDYTIGDAYRPNAKGVALMVEGVFRAVDAGLRWRLEVINHIRASQQSQQQVLP
jgi:acyl-CoA thioesterase-1